jgi:hypothetical protein
MKSIKKREFTNIFWIKSNNFSPIRDRDRDYWKKITGTETIEKNYWDRDRRQNQTKFTGTGTGTIEKINRPALTGTGTKKTWSRTSLVMTSPFISYLLCAIYINLTDYTKFIQINIIILIKNFLQRRVISIFKTIQ